MLICFSAVFAQKTEEAKGNSPEARVDQYFRLADSLSDIDRNRAISYAEKALDLARELDYKKGIAESATFLGYYMRYRGQPDRALELTLEAIEAAKKVPEKKHLAFAYVRLSPIYANEGDFQRAVKSGEQAVKIYEEIDDQEGLGWAFNILGEAYRKSDELDRAYYYYSQAGDIFSTIQDQKGIGIIENNKGLVTLAKGNYQRALENLQRSEAIGYEINMPSLYLESAEGVVRSYIGLEQWESGAEIGVGAIKRAKAEGFKPYERQLALDLAQIFKQLGKFAEALSYQERAYELQGELMDEDVQKKLASLDLANEMKIKEAKMQLLDEKNRRNQLINIFLISGLVIFSVIATFLYRSNRQRNQLNRQLEQQNKKLEDLNQEKDHLMGIVAHDLKSPLNNVKMMAKLLEMTGGLSEDQKGFVARISKSVEDGTALIQNLLDLSTLEEGKGKIEVGAIDLSTELSEAINQNKQHAKTKQIEIHQDFPGAGLNLKSDGQCVRRIVDNLLSNAIKYSPKGKQVWVEAARNGKGCHFSVRDEGPGISPRDQKLLFRKFQKLTARPTAGESSSGLGLAIVKALVEELEGKIEVSSTLGEGTTFTVSLPDLES